MVQNKLFVRESNYGSLVSSSWLAVCRNRCVNLKSANWRESMMENADGMETVAFYFLDKL